jgi:hypothetical protein
VQAAVEGVTSGFDCSPIAGFESWAEAATENTEISAATTATLAVRGPVRLNMELAPDVLFLPISRT